MRTLVEHTRWTYSLDIPARHTRRTYSLGILVERTRTSIGLAPRVERLLEFSYQLIVNVGRVEILSIWLG